MRVSTLIRSPMLMKSGTRTSAPVSIVAGFSFGTSKAHVVVTEGGLLGHHVSRNGSEHDPEKTQAIDEFAVLKDATQVRQFVGSTNWVRRYLFPCYEAAQKALGEYMKEGAVFPKGGIGSSDTPGCKAYKAIKLMCRHAIQKQRNLRFRQRRPL